MLERLFKSLEKLHAGKVFAKVLQLKRKLFPLLAQRKLGRQHNLVGKGREGELY
jgi:hypothetical protein